MYLFGKVPCSPFFEGTILLPSASGYWYDKARLEHTLSDSAVCTRHSTAG